MATTTSTHLEVRAMTAGDLREVRRIERAAYGRTAPGTAFERELHNGLAQYLVAVDRAASPPPVEEESSFRARVRRLLHLAPPHDRIVGFVGVWFTHDQLHIVTIAVDPPAQHRGIAQRLLFECHTLAVEAESKSIALEVRPSNARARRLYEWFGFRVVGTLRAYYSDNGEDATVMLTPPLDDAEFAARIEVCRAELSERGAEGAAS